jgi:hypothetical protein
MTWREMVGWGLVAAGDAFGVAAAWVKGGHVRSAYRGRHGLHGGGWGLGVHQQAEGLKRDGPSAFATRAVKGRGVRWYLLLGTPTQQPFDATHLLIQRTNPTDVSRSKLGGGVSVDKRAIAVGVATCV